MATRLLLCLMLCCIAVPAMAREASMLSAGGSCAVSQDEAADAEATRGPADKRAVQATPATRTAPPQRRGSEAEAATRPPRWHSFLPGMFR